ncbi:uncharacterized protein LOC125663054 [Ostrea edulis]|uniref:uncharacterized protein LOC125663054 n=1 Tax=Ostrea edulis TaxID=37623 RepID=UPI0024AF85CB|nr:uncharacterized protein LOC125663054 [Ostrea edulis]
MKQKSSSGARFFQLSMHCLEICFVIGLLLVTIDGTIQYRIHGRGKGTGILREKDKTICKERNFCQNGGTCVPSLWPMRTWRCVCPEGWSGRRCQKCGRKEPTPSTMTGSVKTTVTEWIHTTITEPTDVTITKPIDITVTQPIDVTVTELTSSAVTEPTGSTANEVAGSNVTEATVSTATEPTGSTATEPTETTANWEF